MIILSNDEGEHANRGFGRTNQEVSQAVASWARKVENKLNHEPLCVPVSPKGYCIVVGEVRERVNRSSRKPAAWLGRSFESYPLRQIVLE